MADCVLNDPGPQPSPTPTTNVVERIASGALVSGSAGMTEMGRFMTTHGETIFVLETIRPNPTPAEPSPCPSVKWAPRFSAIPVAQDTLALVTVYGTPQVYDNASFYLTDMQDAPIGTITPSATVPSGLPSSIVPMTIPSGNKGGYFTVKIPAGQSQTQSFSYRSSKNGKLNFQVQLEVKGTQSSRVVTDKGATVFRPRIKFTTPERKAAAGACSDALTVETIDGNSATIDVIAGTGPGTVATIRLSGAPADIFLDNQCVYPTTSMSIANPVPPPPTGGRPASTISSSRATFYFRAGVAQFFPITATYVEGSTEITKATQIQEVTSKDPVALMLAGPTSVNQSECSAAFKIRLLDSLGNEAGLKVAKALNLGAGGSGTFHLSASCTDAPISALNIPAGASQSSFYVRDSAPEILQITVSESISGGSAIQGDSASLRVLALDSMVSTTDPAVAKRLAIRLHDRLVGLPIALDDPKLAKMSDLILAGKILDAAHLATDEDGFYNITLRTMVTTLSNRLFNPLEPLNDFITTWIGTVRDDRDARELLTGNRIYVGKSLKTSDDQHCASTSVYKNNAHYDGLQSSFANLRTELVPVRQCAYNTDDFGIDNPTLLTDAAGLLTTRTWGVQHLHAGTNRRAIEFAFNVFLCRTITELSDSAMPDWHIRRDVDRAPAGNPQTFTASCRACHGGLDALSGAFAFFDAYPNPNANNDFRLFYVNKGGYGAEAAMEKMNQNGTVFPPGWITGDDSWINNFTENRNKSLNWSNDVPARGNGIHDVGNMLANSGAFSACMAKRVFKEVCKHDAEEGEVSLLSDLSRDFEASGYNMRRLFEKTASLSACIGDGGN